MLPAHQVRDEKGRKMSKSLGNVVDPVETIQQYGAGEWQGGILCWAWLERGGLGLDNDPQYGAGERACGGLMPCQAWLGDAQMRCPHVLTSTPHNARCRRAALYAGHRHLARPGPEPQVGEAALWQGVCRGCC